MPGKCLVANCRKQASYGVPGTRKAKFCSSHSSVEMVYVLGKKCGIEGCFKRPSYGVAGSEKADFCAEHATTGMVNVVAKRCGKDGCAKPSSYGVAGSGRADVCAMHARMGMVNVVAKTCSNDGCFKRPTYGVAGTRTANFCSKHARIGMVDVVNKKCGVKGCFKQAKRAVRGIQTGRFCKRHARNVMANMTHTAEHTYERNTFTSHLTHDGAIDIIPAESGEKRRRRSPDTSSTSSAIGFPCTARTGGRQDGFTPPLASRSPAAGIDSDSGSVESQADVRLKLARTEGTSTKSRVPLVRRVRLLIETEDGDSAAVFSHIFLKELRDAKLSG